MGANPGGGGGGSHWFMMYGDAQRLKGAFSSYLVYQWVVFCPRPNARNLQNWVYFGKFGQKKHQFVPNWVFLWQLGIVMGHKIKNRGGRNSRVYFEHPLTKFFEDPPPRELIITLLITDLSLLSYSFPP